MRRRPLGKRSRATIAKIEKYSAHNYAPYEFVVHKAKGAWLYDPEGNAALDLLSAYSSIPVRHNWDVPIQALTDAYEFSGADHTSRGIYSVQYGEFVEKLALLTGFARVLPASDGRSSTEPVIDVCMMHASQRGIENPEVIVFKNYFHGRARTFSTNAAFDLGQSAGKGAAIPGLRVVEHSAEAVRQAINKNTVAIFMEIHRGEGGPLFDDGTYVEVHELAREYGLFIIVDDVQAGLYRCGYLLSYREFGEAYRPDAVVLGKALGGGEIPVSALVGTEEFMSVLTPGTHGSTFGGYPRASVVASAVLDYFRDHAEIGGRMKAIGARFVKNLSGIPNVDVENRGALIALKVRGIPSTEPLCKEMLCGEWDPNVFMKHGHRHEGWAYTRISPPGCITNEEIDKACANTIRPVLLRAREIAGSCC